jgi:hypothetical protein
MHFETIPVAVVRKIAKPLPRRSGNSTITARRFSVVGKSRAQAPLIRRRGN